MEEAEHAGATYYKSTHEKYAKDHTAGHVAGPRTLLMAEEATLQKMLTKSDAPRPLVDKMRSVSLKHDFIVHFLAEPLFAAAERQGVSADEMISALGDDDATKTMLKDLRSLYITFDSTGDALAVVGIEAKDETTAQTMHTVATQGVAQAKAMYPLFAPQLGAMFPPNVVDPLQETATELLEGIKIELDGAKITGTVPQPTRLAELAEELAKMAEQFEAGGIPGGGFPGGRPPGGEPPGDDSPEEGDFPQEEGDATPDEDVDAFPE